MTTLTFPQIKSFAVHHRFSAKCECGVKLNAVISKHRPLNTEAKVKRVLKEINAVACGKCLFAPIGVLTVKDGKITDYVALELP